MGSVSPELPLEVKQMVCSYPTPKDLKSVRLANRDLAAAGAVHVLPRLFVFNLRESIDEVKEILQHAIISRNITTLIYSPCFSRRLCGKPTPSEDRNGFTMWTKFKYGCYVPHWKDFKPYQKPNQDGVVDKRSERVMRRAHELYQEACDTCPVASPVLVEQAWTRNRDTVAEQPKSSLQDGVCEAIALACSSCPRLDHLILGVSLELCEAMRRGQCAGVRPFLPTMDTSYENQDFFNALTQSLNTRALTGHPLKDLTIASTRYPDFMHTQSSDIAAASLRSIRLRFSHTSSNRPRVTQLLSATKLEVLRISTCLPKSSTAYATETLRQVLCHDWPALKTFTLSRVITAEEVLVPFLLRHKHVLRRLSITSCRVAQGTWFSVFDRIAGRLRVLRVVRLRGQLMNFSHVEFNLPYVGTMTRPHVILLQDSIIHGYSIDDQYRPHRIMHQIFGRSREPFDQVQVGWEDEDDFDEDF